MAKTTKKRETFICSAPNASTVSLVGSFTDWKTNPIQLKKQKDGTWKTTVSLPPGTHEYRFLVDGEWHNDTQCTTFKPNPFGADNCIRVVS